jgi:hypothetical protein
MAYVTGANKMSELEKLKAQQSELAERIAKLEEAAKPAKPVEYVHQRPDYTAGMTMGRSAMQAMIDAVPESVMADLRADARKPNPIQASQSPVSTSSAAQSEPQKRGTGWIEPRPLESPPGLKYVDAQIDAQDAKDKAELALKIAKARMGKGEMK